MSDINELRPNEICLGNFIDCMGKIECITGVMQEEKGKFAIGHTGWNHGNGFIPDGINFHAYPVTINQHWKVCLGIEKDTVPEWIKYVHQVQNYYLWALQINLHEQMDWDLLPKEN